MTQDYQITKLSSTTSGSGVSSGVSSGVTEANGQAGTTKTSSLIFTGQTSSIKDIMKGLQVETDEVDASQQAAREKFDKLQASNGMTYEKARDIVKKTLFMLMNAAHIQEQDDIKKEFKMACTAVREIEQNNAALFAETGYTSLIHYDKCF